jgi:cytochrome c peroxidase
MTSLDFSRFGRFGSAGRLFTVAVSTLSLVACGSGGGSAAPGQPIEAATALSVSTLLFEEKALSASGQQACASCHASETAHADPAGTTLPVGGAALNRQGSRSSPSMLYLESNGPFRFASDGEPFGGFTWDGRANTRADQAGGPLLDAAEMDNASIAEVAGRVRKLSYYADFRAVFGLGVDAGDLQIFDTLRLALEQYQKLDSDYLLFNSRYDRWMDGSGTLNEQELRGLAIFENPARGNCASCHPSQPASDGARPVFTTFGYAALGVPRNQGIAANADPTFFDMGLCGPKRTDLAARTDLCGKFKIPTLRNIELTGPYFHNGAVATLEQAVAFYATRDIDPQRWYPLVGGNVDRFNDLPVNLRGNVIQSAPFGLQPGAPPRLSATDAADLVAFLRTLTDDQTAPQASAKVATR